MLQRRIGDHKLRYSVKAASTVFANGGVVQPDGAGAVIPATATSMVHMGVIMRDVLATDADYATVGVRVPIDVCEEGEEFIADVVNGPAVASMEGKLFDLNATGDSVDVSSQVHKVVTVIKVLSPLKVVVTLNSQIDTLPAI